MLRQAKNLVSNGSLQTGSADLPVGSAGWYAWLAQHDRFSYQGKYGHFTALRETRRQKTFWYAYRRRSGKLFKQYLGKSEELSAERLEYASMILAGQKFLEQYAGRPSGESSAAIEPRIDTTLLPITKVTIPGLPLHLITRPRLARQINTPLVLISAPSGFGKSTLMSDWTRTCGYPVAWLSLDDGDNYIPGFWHSVTVALQTLHPDLGKELPGDLHTASSMPLSEIVARLTNDIARIQAGFPRIGLVLDDFHHIRRAETHDSIQSWLEIFPVNLQLVIAGHTRPPFSLGHLRSRGLLTELDASDLRFNLDEGIRYLQQYLQEPPLADRDLEKLVRHTEGWAAGLTLAAIALGKQEDRRQFIDTFSGAHIYLREYFIETVLQHSSLEVQEFLLKTAILKNLSGSLCDAVTGQNGGDAMLSRLWQENIFIARLEEPGWYRYHDLFAEMLLSQLKARYPGEASRLHQRAAQWYRTQNAPADAVSHLLAIEAWEEAASLIEAMALRELEQYGEDSRLLRWLQELPEEVVQKHKTLLSMYLRLADVALPKQKIERFIDHIENDLSRKAALQRTPDERGVLEEIHRIRSTWDQGMVYPPQGSDGSEKDARWEVLGGLHLLKEEKVLDSQTWEDKAASLLHRAQAHHNLFVILMVGGVLARHVLIGGQLRRSEKLARQVLEQALLQRGKLPEPASIALTVLSEVCLERNELEQAQRYLMQAQEVDPDPTSTNMIVQAAILRAKIQAARGNIDEALANMCAVRELHTRRPSGMWVDQDLLAYEARFYLRKGDVALAEQCINQTENTGEHPLSQLARAELLLAKQQPGDAEREFSHLVAQYPSGIFIESLMTARVELAVAMLAQHKNHQALRVISEVVRAAAPERFFRPFLECGPGFSRVCAPLLLLALNTEKLTYEAQSFIKEILRLYGHVDAWSPAEMEALTTSASISQREQEVLHLLSRGHSNSEMAAELYLSESTIKTHLRNIYEKLGVSSRTEAVAFARQLGILP